MPTRALTLLLILLVPSIPRLARAEPWFGWGEGRVEDRFEDGEWDEEDLVTMRAPRGGVAASDLHGRSWVSLVGFYRELPLGQRDYGAIAVVGLALDKIASGRVHRTRDPPRYWADGPPPAPAAAPPPPPAPAPPPAIAPIARKCVAAAWRAGGLGVDDARLDAMVARAQASAALPEARIRVMRVFQQSDRTSTPSTADSTYYDASGANLWLEARLTWRLDRLLYADDEPTLERVRLERQDARLRLAVQVLQALFQWQRAVVDVAGAPEGSRERAEAELRRAEGEAMLDVLTGGWFSAWRTREASRGA